MDATNPKLSMVFNVRPKYNLPTYDHQVLEPRHLEAWVEALIGTISYYL
jgi:hypothetical protein